MSFSCAHDIPESFSGDITHDFKKRSEDFEILYDKICNLVVEEITKDNPLKESIKKACSGMGNGSLEGEIVRMCDVMDPLIYAINEVNMGNCNMLDVVENCYKILSLSKLESVKFITEIIIEKLKVQE